MRDWHPDAIRVPGESAGSHVAGAGPKILHHTTEGSTAAGAIGEYRKSRSWPTFTLEWTGARLRIYQHMPVNMAARALEHPAGTPETNRAGCVQLEHVGFAATSEDWPLARLSAIGAFCRWVEAQTDCPAATVPGTQWGVDHPPRVGAEAFVGAVGHAGHQHAPNNHHWDPGQLRIDAVVHVDDSARRDLKIGDSGSDVRALQAAVGLRALRCGRSDHIPARDGHYGLETKRDAIFIAYVLGIGSSQKSLARHALSAQVQRWIRAPQTRNGTQKARAVGRRKRHCKGR